MIYLKLFLTFLEIGAVSFGGGYGMIPLIRDKVISNGWLTEDGLLNFIAVSESTPGPIAVNIATFVGAEKGGILGSLLATLGVVLPAFVIILIISAVIKNLLRYAGVNAFLSGIRPCIVGLIIATAVTMALSKLLGINGTGGGISADIPGIIIFVLLFLIRFVWKKLRGKAPSPVLMIIISACFGMLLYPVI